MLALLLVKFLSAVFAATKNFIPNDGCTYRNFILDNKLEVFLVQEPTLSMVQVSLDVSVGSMHEPDEYNGLAHFLEHILFLGSTKFSEEGGFRRFIGMHSGMANASTGPENTNFYFMVRQNYIEEALDRFSQFFISPTFGRSGKDDGMESGIMREMRAVDSEFRGKVQNEAIRLKRMVSLLYGEKHPLSRFSGGNLETLRQDGIVEAVIAFYKKNYSANLMKLVVRSGLNLVAVEKMIRDRFSAIPNLNLHPAVWNLPGFTESGKLVKYKLLQEGREVHYVFAVPGPEPYKFAPFNFLSTLMMNEEESGLLYQLKQKNLLLTVTPRFMLDIRGLSLVCISFSLTPHGMEQLNTITLNLFAYIDFLKASVFSQEMLMLFQEYKQMQRLGESFEVKDNDYALIKARWMHNVSNNMDDLLMTPLEFDPDLIHKFWSYLTMDNVNVILSSGQFDNLPLKEKFYQIEYSLEKLKLNGEDKLLEFRLPRPNRFIPENIQFYGNLVQLSNSIQRPELIAEDLWYKMDDSFGQPKSVIYLLLQSPDLMEKVHFYAAVKVYVSMVFYQMASLFQKLNVAMVNVNLNYDYGLQIRISGFSDKLPEALESIIEALTGPLDKKYFDMAKTQVLMNLKSKLLEPSYKQAEYFMNQNLLVRGFFSVEELIKATNALAWEDLKPELLTGLKPTMLVVGNTLRETTIQLFNKLKKVFRGHEDRGMEIFDRKSVGKIYNQGPILPLENAIAVYYPITKQANYHVFCAVLMLDVILSGAFFDALRTKEQLGYTVRMHVYGIHDSVGLMFKVQSKFDPPKLNQRVHKFISEEANAVIDKMSPNDLNAVKDSLIARRFSWPDSLLNEAQLHWRVITASSDLFFEWKSSIRLYLRSTPIESLKKEMINIINKMSDPKNSVAVHITGGNQV